ncbi:MAG: hypothetical protein R2726_22295 [Acidimicrobiales bacterium]
MDGNTAYIAAGWLVTFGTLAAYVGVLLRRGRRLSRQVPPESRRWM